MPKTYDVDALIEELELDPEDIAELIGDFREFLEDTLPQLESAVAAGDLTESRSLAHSIKGSAGNLRVQAVYGVAKDMQDEADNQNLDKLKELVQLLRQHGDEFMKEAADV